MKRFLKCGRVYPCEVTKIDYIQESLV